MDITAEQFMYALRKIDIYNQPIYLDLLTAQYSAPSKSRTASQLAKDLGVKTYTTINLRYGELGRKIAEALDIPSPANRNGENRWWLILSEGKKIGKGFSWIMRGELAEALERLSLVENDGTRTYYYPTSATEDDFVKAFSAKGLLTESELLQLITHYRCVGHRATPTDLAMIMGEPSYQTISQRNVSMAKKLSGFLGIEPPLREDGSKRWWAFLTIARPNGSHWELELKPDVVSAIEQTGLNSIFADDYADHGGFNDPHTEIPHIEGAVKRIHVNAYERDPQARIACIRNFIQKHGGLFCSICKFDFEKQYGPLGKGYIHIHHITPLSSIRKDYAVDPVNDLVPVCPNCHAMLHRGNDVMSVESLKSIVEQYRDGYGH